jgi:hypothetical protein
VDDRGPDPEPAEPQPPAEPSAGSQPPAEQRPRLVPDFAVPAAAGPPGAADRARRARWRWAGVALGMLAHLAFMGIDLAQMSGPDSTYRGLAYAVLSAIGTPVLLVTGGVCTIWAASRQFGIGLLIGTGAGLVIFGGVCVAILASSG